MIICFICISYIFKYINLIALREPTPSPSKRTRFVGFVSPCKGQDPNPASGRKRRLCFIKQTTTAYKVVYKSDDFFILDNHQLQLGRPAFDFT